MSEPMKGFNAAQRAHDAQEHPDYWEEPLDTCPNCGDGEMMPQVHPHFVSERNPQRYVCDNCGWEP